MLVFKKVNTKRCNTSLDGQSDTPAKEDGNLEEATRIGWKQTPENKKLPRKISFDEKEFHQLSIPVKRKVSSDSKHFMDGTDYSPVATKIRKVSEDDDSEIGNEEIEVHPNHLQEEDIEVESKDSRSCGYSTVPTKGRRVSEDDGSEIENDEIEERSNHLQEEDSEVEIGDVRSPCIGFSQDVKTMNYLKPEEETYSERHSLSQIPPTEKKKWPQKPCVTCRRYGVRHDTRYYCKCCNVALCKEPCFQEYHSM